ncbi:MAG: hypothetical protein LBJ89_01445 [Holosporales bacterium]|jgi:hypothetical protein|nr:hypothetical protein [Holosporales bacterium]
MTTKKIMTAMLVLCGSGLSDMHGSNPLPLLRCENIARNAELTRVSVIPCSNVNPLKRSVRNVAPGKSYTPVIDYPNALPKLKKQAPAQSSNPFFSTRPRNLIEQSLKKSDSEY